MVNCLPFVVHSSVVEWTANCIVETDTRKYLFTKPVPLKHAMSDQVILYLQINLHQRHIKSRRRICVSEEDIYTKHVRDDSSSQTRIDMVELELQYTGVAHTPWKKNLFLALELLLKSGFSARTLKPDKLNPFTSKTGQFWPLPSFKGGLSIF